MHDRATLRNEDHIGNKYARGPLATNEVAHLARSVSRWTWRNIAPIDGNEWIKQRQSQRGRKGSDKQWGDSKKKVIQKAVDG